MNDEETIEEIENQIKELQAKIDALKTLKRMDKKLKTETDELSPEAWLERLIGIMDGEELNEY